MSYVRFGEADVYVYADVGGFLCCCMCSLGEQEEFYSTDQLISHLREHQQAGDNVPDFVFADLEADREENQRWLEASKKSEQPVSKRPSARFRRGIAQVIEESRDTMPAEYIAALEEVKGE